MFSQEQPLVPSFQPAGSVTPLREVIFIDRGVEDYQFLAQGVKPGVEVHLLDADALAQMTAVLAGRNDLKAVHLVSHGAPGCLYLGEGELSLSTLTQHETALRSWFADGGNERPELLLYGCNVAVGDAGTEFLDKLQGYTEANIAASKDVTGHAKHQGNWELTVRRGFIEAKTAFLGKTLAAYSSALNPNNFDVELVKDINSGPGSASPENLTVLGDQLFFRANDGSSGIELWVSDGTEAGTTRVKDIYSGAGSAFPSELTVLGDQLFFQASDGSSGFELWVSDGTEAGTTRVKDIYSGTDSASPFGLTVLGDQLFFRANDGSSGPELWVSDGTEAGTTRVKDINSGSGSASPDELTVLGDQLFFRANDGSSGTELWVSDGTEAGTTLVKDINSGFGSAFLGELTVLGDQLFFQANDGSSGTELWISDGTEAGTTLVKDINSGSGSALLGELTVLGDQLFFRANDGSSGTELWVSDGTEAGTTLVKDIRPGSGSAYPFGLTVLGDQLFFQANDGSSGKELWVLKENAIPTGSVTIAGTATEDSALTAANTLDDADGIPTNGFSYQWQQGDGNAFTNIADATNASFTPGDDQVGQQLQVVVSYTDDNGTAEMVTSSTTDAVANVNDEPAGGITLPTSATEDSAITADTTGLTDADGIPANGFSYQWQSSNDGTAFTNIVDATNASFTPGDDQVGQQLQVVVSYTDDNGTAEMVTSSTTDAVANVNDEPVVDQAIATQNAQEEFAFSFAIPTNAFGDLDDASLTYSAQLDEGGEGIPFPQDYWLSFDGTTFTGTPENADVGDITLAVTATDSGSLTATQVFTLSIANTNDLPRVGTNIEDQAATEDAAFNFTVAETAFEDIDPGDSLSFTAQINSGTATEPMLSDFPQGFWLSFDANSRAFSGTPADGDVGAVVVRVTATDTADATAFQEFTLNVGNENDLPTGLPTLPSSVTEEQAITVDTTAIGDADGLGQFSYQWQAQEGGEGGEGDFVNIANATSDNFTPDDNEVGDTLRVVVSYTDGQGTAEMVTSQATTAVSGINDAPTLSGPSSIDVAEDATPDTVLATFAAADVDSPAPLLSISAGNDAGLFSINSAGEVSLVPNAELNFEGGTNRYNLTITASEDPTGNSPLTTDASLTLNVTNVIEGSDPASIAWNTETGVVSALSIDAANATASLSSIDRTIIDPNWALQTVGDMDGDGQKDVLLRHATVGQNLVWYMNPGGQSIRTEALIGREVPDADWSIAGTGDMNGDGNADIVLRNQAADQILAWYMDGQGNILSEGLVGRGFGDNNWKIEAMADFNSDGKADILLRHAAAGQNLLWEMDGPNIIGESLFGREVPDVNWQIEGANDFDGNGTIDVLMRHVGAGQALLWSMADKNNIDSEILIANVPDGTSQIVF